MEKVNLLDQSHSYAKKFLQCVEGAQESRKQNDKELYEAYAYDAIKHAEVASLFLQLAQKLDKIG